jgi:hypothetical protein
MAYVLLLLVLLLLLAVGLWQGRSVAIKVISHCSADYERISRELALR